MYVQQKTPCKVIPSESLRNVKNMMAYKNNDNLGNKTNEIHYLIS